MKYLKLFLIAALLFAARSYSATTSANVGQSLNLTVTADGTQPFTYQWFKDGAPISGATSQTYSISNVAASDAGSYTVKVSNSAGSIVSDPAALAIGSPPSNAVISVTIVVAVTNTAATPAK